MRRWGPWVLVAAAILVIAVATNRASDSGNALDPRSTGPLGARGLVLLLREFDAHVTVGPALMPTSGGVALLLRDDIGDAQRRRLRSWVRSGGTLVVTDPLSIFSPALVRSGGNPFVPKANAGDRYEPGCSLPPLADVRSISVPNAALYRVPTGGTGCFMRDQGAYFVARAEGKGSVIALGGGAPFVNRYLDTADNAVFAVGLLAPRPAASIVILQPDAPGSGRKGVLALVSKPVRSGIWQLLAAFLVIVLWRARRLGRPVPELQPVAIDGSELVVAVGNLLQHAGRRDAAGGMLRLHLRRELAERLGLPPDAPAELLASALAPFGVDPDRVLAALSSAKLGDDRALVELARSIDVIRREVTHV
jgi:hypothetical protein